MNQRSTTTRETITKSPPFFLDKICASIRKEGLEIPTDIEDLAFEAARAVENLTRTALVSQIIRIMVIDPEQRATVMLPIGPVKQDDVPVVTADGEPYTDFRFRGGNRPSIDWRGDFMETLPSRMMIAYEAGFGPTAQYIPADLAQAVIDQTALMLSRGSPAYRMGARYREVKR